MPGLIFHLIFELGNHDQCSDDGEDREADEDRGHQGDNVSQGDSALVGAELMFRFNWCVQSHLYSESPSVEASSSVVPEAEVAPAGIASALIPNS